jgi:hypothetical protein
VGCPRRPALHGLRQRPRRAANHHHRAIPPNSNVLVHGNLSIPWASAYRKASSVH